MNLDGEPLSEKWEAERRRAFARKVAAICKEFDYRLAGSVLEEDGPLWSFAGNEDGSAVIVVRDIREELDS